MTASLGSPAGAVSSRVPVASASGSILFGKSPVRPEVTRRVVATKSRPASQSIEPLGLLFRMAQGVPATPTQVLEPPAPPPTPAPTPVVVETPAAPTPAPPPAPVWNGQLPPMGEAFAWGCAAAMQYLEAYAAPGFTLQCPGNAGGHEATTTCISGTTLCGDGASIVIAEPCPAAYMNEASNSWVLIGVWTNVPLDPYGQCS
ncbi:MAG TPA: hypothetical protein VGF87_09900 [Acidimicrobiales bacterium]